MMRQFAVWRIGGRRWLLAVDATAYDFMTGFHRLIKLLD